jgi:hypothetical protein
MFVRRSQTRSDLLPNRKISLQVVRLIRLGSLTPRGGIVTFSFVPALEQDSITFTNSFVLGLDQQYAYEVATFVNMPVQPASFRGSRGDNSDILPVLQVCSRSPWNRIL